MPRGLSKRVVVQTKTRTYFEGGAYTTSWATTTTIWADVEYMHNSSKEVYSEEKEQQMSFYEVVVRNDVTLTNKNRLLYDGNIFVIEHIGPLTERNRRRRLKCRLENT